MVKGHPPARFESHKVLPWGLGCPAGIGLLLLCHSTVPYYVDHRSAIFLEGQIGNNLGFVSHTPLSQLLSLSFNNSWRTKTATDSTSTNEHGVVPTKLDLACGLWFANLCLRPAGLSKPHNFLSIFSIMLQSTGCFQFAGHWAQTYTHGRSLAFFPLTSMTKSDILPNYHVTKHIASSFAISFLWLLFTSGGHRCSEDWPSYITENKPIVHSWHSGLNLGLADPT